MHGYRFLLVAINYWPELTGIGKYTGELAERLAQQGFTVRVIAAPPYYPAWRIQKGYSGWRYRRERSAGVEILRCPLWVPGRQSGIKRIIHLMSFAITSFPVILWSGLRWRPDAVFVVEPPLFCVPAALLAARISRARSWLHIQDFEVEAAFNLGILKRKRVMGMVRSAETWLMKKFGCVSTISENMLVRLAERSIPNTILFPNWVNLDLIHPAGSVSPYRKEWGIPEAAVVVLYSGNMGQKHGIEILLDAARILCDRIDARFVLCGDGAALRDLVGLARGLPNVMFMPLQPLNRLNDLLNLADIHVLPQRSDAEDLVLPSKLSNMLASGRPVVATANPQTQIAKILEGCGIVTPPGDSIAFATAIEKLAEMPLRRLDLGVRARKQAEKAWDMDRIMKTFQAELMTDAGEDT